tara:strand:+ start:473 stop:685 length:213 start_codon:yes stop_codon:yes gene_type:complete
MITTHKLFLRTPKGVITINVDSSQIKIGHTHSHVWLTAHQSKKVLKSWGKKQATQQKLTTLDRQYTLLTK